MKLKILTEDKEYNSSIDSVIDDDSEYELFQGFEGKDLNIDDSVIKFFNKTLKRNKSVYEYKLNKLRKEYNQKIQSQRSKIADIVKLSYVSKKTIQTRSWLLNHIKSKMISNGISKLVFQVKDNKKTNQKDFSYDVYHD